MSALVEGDALWLGLAVAVLAWVVATTLAGPSRLPGLRGIARWICSCWLSRLLALAAWSGAGWHLFCQRP